MAARELWSVFTSYSGHFVKIEMSSPLRRNIALAGRRKTKTKPVSSVHCQQENVLILLILWDVLL